MTAIYLIAMIAQPLIMGYTATKYRLVGNPVGIGIFWGLVACILSWSIGLLLEMLPFKAHVHRSELEQFGLVVIALGLSSTAVLVIFTILPKKL